METALELAGLAGATLASLFIALLLEWLCLLGLMRLMPARTLRPAQAASSRATFGNLLRMSHPGLKG